MDCSTCDCADKTKCVKTGNSYGVIIDTEKSYIEAVVMEAPAAAEHDGKCKCGPNCACTNCTCGQ